MADINAVLVTEAEVLDHLGIDYADDMVLRNVARCIKTADAYLKGSIGENYPISDPRAKELALIIIADLYENRSMHASVQIQAKTRQLVDDLSLQLRMDLRRASDG